MKRFLALFGFVALLASCTSNEKEIDMSFDTVETLECDSVAVNEILKPSDWFAVESSRAVVHSPRSEKLFYVYSLPEWKYLYNHLAPHLYCHNYIDISILVGCTHRTIFHF